mmetsp:Transcript_60003/g.83363  ORF Transcript_60003/g.83363 Transcript_60003/m.83363 type:complete len:142 (+) Transcript_60003:256-681(+)
MELMSQLINMLALALCAFGADAAAENRCGEGNASPAKCFATVPSGAGVGQAPCCWTRFMNNDPPLCLGQDVAREWTANGNGMYTCDPHRPSVTIVGSIVAAVGLVAVVTAIFMVMRRRQDRTRKLQTSSDDDDVPLLQDYS